MKHSSSELKRLAKGKLLGNYAVPMGAMVTVTLISFCTALFSFFFMFNRVNTSGTFLSIILSYLINLIIGILTAVFSAGISSLFLKLCRGKEYKLSDILYAFKNYPDHVIGIIVLQFIMIAFCFVPMIVAVTFLYAAQKSILWILLIILAEILSVVGAVLITLTYSQAIFLYIDNPEKKVMELLGESRALMRGNKGRLFYLYVSFIGLSILSVFSCYIGFLWVGPYMNATMSLFYLDLKGELP